MTQNHYSNDLVLVQTTTKQTTNSLLRWPGPDDPSEFKIKPHQQLKLMELYYVRNDFSINHSMSEHVEQQLVNYDGEES